MGIFGWPDIYDRRLNRDRSKVERRASVFITLEWPFNPQPLHNFYSGIQGKEELAVNDFECS